MFLTAWFDLLEESFSYKEVQFKIFCPSVKATGSPAGNVNEKNVYVIGHSPLGLFRTNVNKQ